MTLLDDVWPIMAASPLGRTRVPILDIVGGSFLEESGSLVGHTVALGRHDLDATPCLHRQTPQSTELDEYAATLSPAR